MNQDDGSRSVNTLTPEDIGEWISVRAKASENNLTGVVVESPRLYMVDGVCMNLRVREDGWKQQANFIDGDRFFYMGGTTK